MAEHGTGPRRWLLLLSFLSNVSRVLAAHQVCFQFLAPLFFTCLVVPKRKKITCNPLDQGYRAASFPHPHPCTPCGV